VPGVNISIQTYGEEINNFNSHLHALVSDGCFGRDGKFYPIHDIETGKMMELFRHKVFKMLDAEEKITERQIEILLSWKNTGFSVYKGGKVDAEDRKGFVKIVAA
jgi:hypothetical protein